MKIHSVCIFRLDGAPIYFQKYTDEFANTDFTLLSSFFGAILQFSGSVIKKKLEIMDMGDLRFFFQNQEDLIFIVITDESASYLLIKDRIHNIAEELFTVCSMEQCKSLDHILEDTTLDKKIKEIISFKDTHTTLEIEPIRKAFESVQVKSDINSGGLLTSLGEIVFSSLPLEDLNTSIKQIEIRTKTEMGSHVMPKMIWQSSDKMIFVQTILSRKLGIPLYVILLFDARNSIGMADFALEEFVKQLDKYT